VTSRTSIHEIQRERVATEVELKLLAPSAQVLGQIARLRSLGPFRLRPMPRQYLHSIYLDTKNQRLARNGVALRLRRDGISWELTAKWSGHRVGVRHERPEINLTLDQAPDLPLRIEGTALHLHLAALVMQQPLEPFLVTNIRRLRREVLRDRTDHEHSIAEIALDSVRLASPAGVSVTAPYFEVEIEKREGSTRQLGKLGRLLRQRFDLEPSAASKFARGIEAIGMEIRRDPQPAPLRADDTLDAALRKIVGLQLRRLCANDPGTRLGDDPEPLHDMRVAIRRLRAALLTFKPALRSRARSNLNDRLRWLGRALGGVRDIDVQLANLDACAEGLPVARRAHLEAFRQYLQRERAVRRRTMLAALDSPRYFALLRRLEEYASGVGAERDRGPKADVRVAKLGRRLVKKRFRRLLASGGALGDAPGAADLHALRLRAKKLRYLLEFLRGFTGPESARIIKRLTELQDVLGAHNDAHVAQRFVQLYREEAGGQMARSVDLALKAVARHEALRVAEAEAEFARVWRSVSRRNTVEQVKAIVDRLRS
jgi:triphosphatase